METLQAIITRRSVRKFSDQKVPQEEIEEILHAAMCAPSAYNEQPWHFVLIDKRDLLKKIPHFHPHATMCEHAPLAILVCSDKKKEKTQDLWIQDCAAASYILLLSAHDKKIGGVWCGVYPRKDRMEGFQELLSLPNEIIPFSLIVLGYPLEPLKEEDRFHKERIHRNHW